MDRVRASSLESSKIPKERYSTYISTINQSNVRDNRIMYGNRYMCDDNNSEYNFDRERRKPLLSNSELKNQLDLLQGTVNKMIKIGSLNQVGSSCHSVNISEALQHEYHQMMSALKELENTLALKRSNSNSMNFSTNSRNDSQLRQLDREIYYRDSLIKCLSNRLKVLCKANDKLIIDYENQENTLSEEVLCLKRQLEKAKDALRCFATLKNHNCVSSTVDMDNELYYLRDSLCTKEMMIIDLKRRIDKLNRENSDLKCELDNKESNISRCLSSQFDRDFSYVKHTNDLMKGQIDSLNTSLNLKNNEISDLQNQLECKKDDNLIRNLQEELMFMNDENELHKEEICEQTEMLENLRNQLDIISENTQFKDETIAELKGSLRKLSDSITGKSIRNERASQSAVIPDQRISSKVEMKSNDLQKLLNEIKKHLQDQNSDLLQRISTGSDPYHILEKLFFDLLNLRDEPSNNNNDIELFKEFLTKEINLKNTIRNFLTINTNGNIDSIEKLQNQIDFLLSIDMDNAFKDDLREYLHQSFLLDDNFRVVIEYLVKYINNIPVKSSVISTSIQAIDHTPVKVSKTSSTLGVGTLYKKPTEKSKEKTELMEEELRMISSTYQSEKKRFEKELLDKDQELSNANKKVKELEILVEKQSSYKMLLEEKSKLLTDSTENCNKIKELSMENERLKADNQAMVLKIKQMEKDLNLQTSELDGLETSLRKLSNKFVTLSSANDNVKSAIDTIKDAQIEKLSKELGAMKDVKLSHDELERLYNEQTSRILSLSKNLESMKQLQPQNSELKELVRSLKSKLDEEATEKNNLLSSLANIQEEKNSEIRDLKSKLSQEMKNSNEMKSMHSDINQDLVLSMQKMKEENQRLSDKLASCLEDKSKLEFKLEELKYETTQKENSKSALLQSSIHSLKLENKSMEMKSNSLESEKTLLGKHVSQLKSRLTDLSKNCSDNHVDKKVLQQELIEADICKQKIMDLESILAVLTEQLNEKVNSLEEIRRKIKDQPLMDLNLDYKCEKSDQSGINQQLLSQKESEISYLKSKLGNAKLLKTMDMTQTRSVVIENLSRSDTGTVLELEKKIARLNEQLTERSNDIVNLQQIIKEKDEIIKNASYMIKTKNDSFIETEKLMHAISLQNMNIKDELSASYEGNLELQMLKSDDNNRKKEIQRLQNENSLLKDSMKDNVNVESLPRKSELEKGREKKLENMDLELKLKFQRDQIQNILIENRRLSGEIEKETKKSSKYEYDLNLKENLLEKLLKEKEKIRETFITELSNKNEELNVKTNTVYFLNAELQRLSSNYTILDAELSAVKGSDLYGFKQSRTLDITQTNVLELNDENSSLKLCVNVKTAEVDAMKNQLSIQKINQKKLSEEIDLLKSNISEKDLRLSKTTQDTDKITNKLASIQNESQRTIENLKLQLKEIREDYENIDKIKIKLEKTLHELSNENISLKYANEELENEKTSYCDEIDILRQKIDILINDLSESKEYILNVCGKLEKEQQKGNCLSDVIEMSEKSMIIRTQELEKTLQQLDEMKEENLEYRNETQRLENVISDLEQKVKVTSDNERKVRLLECENEGMAKELEKHQSLEEQLYECIKIKSIDCEELRKECTELLDMQEKYQQQIYLSENKEQMTQELLNLTSSKCECLRDNLDVITNNLCIMEADFLQQKNQYETIKCENERQREDLIRNDTKIQELQEECTRLNQENFEIKRLKCENNSLRNYNTDMSCQIQTLTTELVQAHTQIWDATSKINENQSTIAKLCSRLNNKLTSDRLYGSQPLLNNTNHCCSDAGFFQLTDYNDLKTRYDALCNQVDNLVCQIKKKNRQILDLENANEINTFNSVNYEQMKCDYNALEIKYRRLKTEYSEMTDEYRCNNQESLRMHCHQVQDIKACTNELQEKINNQNQELEELKNLNQVLNSDYHECCDRSKDLENQRSQANLELENWQNTYYNKIKDLDTMEKEINNLRQQNENYLLELDEKNDLIQDSVITNNRMIELENYNKDLELQTENYKQNITAQNVTIDNLTTQLNNLESYYECEVDQCRKDILVLKGNGRSSSTKCFEEINEKNEIIECLNEEMKLAQLEIANFNEQYNLQCKRYIQLQRELDNQIITKEELQQEYQDQCLNIDKLSAELFETRELNEENECEIKVLLEKLDKATEYNNKKENEIQENQRNMESLENNLAESEFERRSMLNQMEEFTEQLDKISPDNVIDMNQLKNDLAICYDTINKLKVELTKKNAENEKMKRILKENDQILMTYDRELQKYRKGIEKKDKDIEKLRRQNELKETNKLKGLSHESPNESDFVQQMIYDSSQVVENNKEFYKRTVELPSPVKTSDNLITDNQQIDKLKKRHDESQGSEEIYSSSKSVSWKVTHTDTKDDSDGGVIALHDAINEFKTLYNDISLPKKSEVTSNDTHSSAFSQKASSVKDASQLIVFYERPKSTRLENDVTEVIFVEVDEPPPQNVPLESKVQVTSVQNIDSLKIPDIVQLLRNCNINVTYDENKETPDLYFGRIMDRYKELEQFFIASMKIQFKKPLDEETVDLFENFSENFGNNREILNEQCRQLNSLIVNTTDLTNDLKETAVKGLTSKDVRNLMDVVKTQQQEMSALNTVFSCLEKLDPFNDLETMKGKISPLRSQYETVFVNEDFCHLDIPANNVTITQMSIDNRILKVPSVDLKSTAISIENVQHDSYLEKVKSNDNMDISRKKFITNKTGSNEISQQKPILSLTPESKIFNRTKEPLLDMSNQYLIKSSLHLPNSIEQSHLQPKEYHVIESSTHNINDDSYLQKFNNNDSIESFVKLNNTKENMHKREFSQSKSIKKQVTESKLPSNFETSVQNVPVKGSIDSSTKLIIQDKDLFDTIITIENIQYKGTSKGNESNLESIEVKDTLTGLGNVMNTLNVTTNSDSVKLNVAKETNINEIHDTIEIKALTDREQIAISVVLEDSNENEKNEHIYMKTISEGLSVSEGKTKNLEKLNKSLSYASVGNFETAMHQLNEIDFNNLNPSIDIKDLIRIYAAEIDYLNEKNLFHTYAVNNLTNPSKFSYNSNFLDNVNNELTAKAKHVNNLQNEFNFDPHISSKEKELILKVLGSDYTYKQQFNDWISLQKDNRKTISSTDQLDQLKKEIDLCWSTNSKNVIENDRLMKELQCEKDNLALQLRNMNRLVEENENLNKQIKIKNDRSKKEEMQENESLKKHFKTQDDKPTKLYIQENKENENVKKQSKTQKEQINKPVIQATNPNVTRQSKIPLLKGSKMEGSTAHTKPTTATPLTNRNLQAKTKTVNPVIVINQPESLVSPSDVKLAIAEETSIDSLRRFSNLLAEDNFDLAGEIEKLLMTIEELRRQLKENCEILSKTVEMIQSSEIFVNDLEKKLSIETKKTQFMSGRVDQLNDLNKQIILELQRIIKGKIPSENSDMDIQERCNYLLMCLKKLEEENKSLEMVKTELQNQLDMSKSNPAFGFFAGDLCASIAFDFETTLLPNGTIVGDISLVDVHDTQKSLALTFDVHTVTDHENLNSTKETSKIAHFSTDEEPTAKSKSKIPEKKFEKDSVPKFKNLNNEKNFNNNCLGSYSSSIPLIIFSPFSQYIADTCSLPIKSHLRESLYFFSIGNNKKIKNFKYQYRSLSDIHLTKTLMEPTSGVEEGGILRASNCTILSNTNGFELLKNIYARRWNSMSSLSTSNRPRNHFINYRTPIYFRKLGDRP